MYTENKQYVLINIAEELVRRKVREIMETYDICKCDKCFLDTCAIVLNTTDPLYVTTEKGSLFSMLDATHYQFKTDLTVSVLQALKVVKDRPHH